MANKSSENINDVTNFPGGLRRILKDRRITQKAFAKEIGTNPQNVSNWLRGHAVPNAVWIVKIANHLNLTLDELFDRELPGGSPLPAIRRHAQAILELSGAPKPEPKPRPRKKK